MLSEAVVFSMLLVRFLRDMLDCVRIFIVQIARNAVIYVFCHQDSKSFDGSMILKPLNKGRAKKNLSQYSSRPES